jgi:RNAse (barnase) inhibitor barstar
MSGLAGILAGHRPPGIYRWTSSLSAAGIEHTVSHAGWRFILLDTWLVEDKDAFLTAAQRAFGFGDDFMHNFDSLGDALADVRHPEGDGLAVLWDGWAPFARADRRAFDVAVDVLAVRARSRRFEPFVVLMRGPGPVVDVPDVDPRAHA